MAKSWLARHRAVEARETTQIAQKVRLRRGLDFSLFGGRPLGGQQEVTHTASSSVEEKPRIAITAKVGGDCKLPNYFIY